MLTLLKLVVLGVLVVFALLGALFVLMVYGSE
jgi:hypothetical protein